MAKYRYICPDCGEEKIILHGMNEEPEVICDQCGTKMNKTIGRINIVLKGDGYYSTENRSKE